MRWDQDVKVIEMVPTQKITNATVPAGNIQITVTLSAAPGTGFEVFQTEYSGLDTTNPVDQVSTAFGQSTSANSGSLMSVSSS